MTDFELINADDDVFNELVGHFPEYNAAHSSWNCQTYCIVHKVEGEIIAGGRGIVNMGALEVRGLWVDEELRGSGVGSRILAAIEDEARRRGASRVMLYTYSWQAQTFYEKAGYTVFSTFDYPDGYQRVDMQKELGR